MDLLGLLGIILGIVLIILFIFKGLNVVVAAPIATIVILIFNDFPILETMFGKENSYMTALADLVATNFAIFLLGTILATYMDKSGATISIASKVLAVVGTKNPFNAMVALFIISAILSYGGINAILLIFALIPMAKPIFKELNISWKLAIIPIFGGSTTFTMTMFPGAPSFHNIVASTSLGTPLTAGSLLGIVAGIVSIIFLLIFMKVSLNRSLKRKETFTDKELVDKNEEVNRVLPSFFASILPLIVLLGIIFSFSSVENIIIVALVAAILLSAILFRKQIGNHKTILGSGANEAASSTLTIASTTAFGSVTTSLPAFSSIFSLIQSIPGPPVLSLMVGTGLISGVTASAVGAVGISVASFAPYYLSLGLDPETVHRAIVIGSAALTSVPYSGFLIIYGKIAGLSIRETFKNGFISICVTHWVAIAVVVIMTLIGLA